MNKKFVLFDFDGVIVNSYHAAFDTSKMIYPDLTEKAYQERFSGNINEAVAKADVVEQRTNIDFFKEYIPRLMESPIVSGMQQVIESLAKKYILIVISSTISSPISDYLNKHGISSFFTEVMGNDFEKSKVKKIRHVFEKYGVSAQDCIFITDTVGDIQEAAETGVKVIAVAWGYQPVEILMGVKGSFPFGIAGNPKVLEERISDWSTSLELADKERVEQLVEKLCPSKGKGATKEEIKEMEGKLNVSFPREYREFLEMYGWLEPPQAFGGGKGVGSEDSVVDQTQELRDLYPATYFARNLAAVYQVGDGNFECIVCDGKDRGKVIFWQHDVSDDEVYPNDPSFWVEGENFWGWLRKKLEASRVWQEESDAEDEMN